MADRSERERAVERLLRHGATGSIHPVDSAGCLDAEQLAAWSEGALPTDAALQVEAHLGSCDRCQAMLAVFAASAPEPPLPAPPFWKHWTLGVLVPVAAASLAVFVWTMVAGDRAVEPEATIARVEQAENPMSAPPAVDSPAAPESLPDRPVATELPEPPAPAADAASATRARGVDAVDDEASASGPQVASTPSPPPAPAAAARARDASAEGDAASEPESRMSFAPPPPSPLAPERPAAADLDTSAALPAAAPGTFAALAPVEFGAPQASVRWRITAAGGLERSGDDGGTWSPVALDTSLFVTSGSAPSAGVCWIVDRGGAVLRSVDGVTFTRTAFTEPVSIIDVRATNAARAIVSATNGQSFTTTDGGVSWTSAP